MWCSHCQADVAVELSADGQQVLCAVCGAKLGEPKGAEDSNERSVEQTTRSARELLERWSSELRFDPLETPLANLHSSSISSSSSPSNLQDNSRSSTNKDEGNGSEEKEEEFETQETAVQDTPKPEADTPKAASPKNSTAKNSTAGGSPAASFFASGAEQEDRSPEACSEPTEDGCLKERGERSTELSEAYSSSPVQKKSFQKETAHLLSGPHFDTLLKQKEDERADFGTLLKQRDDEQANVDTLLKQKDNEQTDVEQTEVEQAGVEQTGQKDVEQTSIKQADTVQANAQAAESLSERSSTAPLTEQRSKTKSGAYSAHSGADEITPSDREPASFVETAFAASFTSPGAASSFDTHKERTDSTVERPVGESVEPQHHEEKVLPSAESFAAERSGFGRPVSQPAAGVFRMDSSHQSSNFSPHFDVHAAIQENLEKDTSLLTFVGQSMAYLGVLGLTAGSCLVLWSYFGGPAQYAPTGWLVTTASQMLLFLGVITLISGGLEQTTRILSNRIDRLGERMIRIEGPERQAVGHGPVTPASAFSQQAERRTNAARDQWESEHRAAGRGPSSA